MHDHTCPRKHFTIWMYKKDGKVVAIHTKDSFSFLSNHMSGSHSYWLEEKEGNITDTRKKQEQSKLSH